MRRLFLTTLTIKRHHRYFKGVKYPSTICFYKTEKKIMTISGLNMPIKLKYDNQGFA